MRRLHGDREQIGRRMAVFFAARLESGITNSAVASTTTTATTANGRFLCCSPWPPHDDGQPRSSSDGNDGSDSDRCRRCANRASDAALDDDSPCRGRRWILAHHGTVTTDAANVDNSSSPVVVVPCGPTSRVDDAHGIIAVAASHGISAVVAVHGTAVDTDGTAASSGAEPRCGSGCGGSSSDSSDIGGAVVVSVRGNTEGQ